MPNIDTKKNFYLPAITLLPCLIYSLLDFIGVPPVYAIGTALFTSVLGDISGRFVFKSWPSSLAFMIITISLILSLASFFILDGYPVHKGFFFILFEIFTVLFVVLSRLNRGVIRLFYIRKKNSFQKKLLKSFYDVGVLISYLFACHLFAVLIFKFLEDADVITHLAFWDRFLFFVVPVIITVIVIAFELFKACTLHTKIKREEWLPIITEKGDVTGRIAKSVSLKMGDKLCHPIVRTALICDEKIYLQERKVDDILSPGKLDYPFEKYTLFSHGIEEAVKNNIAYMMTDNDKRDMEIQYVMKYTFENGDTKRLIFLFTAKIPHEDQIKKTERMTGKFWTLKQIEDAFADEIFAENFELEFEYLKNLILRKDGIGA